MNEKNVPRRQFSRWTAVAFGGLVAGSAINPKALSAADEKLPIDPNLLLKGLNTCKGLNACKAQGKGDHSCAGAGSCATANKHACGEHNDCAGQGGCGGYPGQNTCKEKGHCAVPLSAESWKLARKQFEEVAKAKGIKVGKPPE